MRLIFQAISAMVILMSTPQGSAHAQGSAVPLAVYVDVMPNAVDSAVALLERYRDASHKQAGNLRFDLLHEIARPNRFAILEVGEQEGPGWACHGSPHPRVSPAATAYGGLTL
jgi:hypothetical protein